MADGQIRILVSAARDSSIESTFGYVEKRAQRAGGAINRALGGQSGGRSNALAKSFEQAGNAADKSARQAERAWNQQLRQLNAVAKNQDRLFERVESNKVRVAEKSARERVRIEERANKEIERAFRSASREAEREEAKRTRAAERELSKQQRARETFASRVSHRATRFMFPAPMGILGAAGRVANGLMQGAGIDLSFQGGVGRSIALEKRAAQISTSAYMEGAKGPSGTRANTGELQSFFRKQAIANGFSSDATSLGLTEFVARTGDLATSRASIPGLLKLAKATGADANDVLSFAGTAAATAFKSPAESEDEANQRARYLENVARIGAKSGKLGTVEFKDLAAYGPKLAASAQAFGGDKVKNMAEMFAAAQLGLEGGAASPAIATTAVASMTNTLKTPARRKQFRAAGVEIDDANNPGKLRAFSDIALESIQAAGGNTDKFKKMWMNVQGARAVEGLRQTYLEAGGGRGDAQGDLKGAAAVRGRFAALGGTLSDKEVNDSFSVNMNTAGTKAQQFQERLDEVTAKMTQELVPALEKLADPTIKLAGWFADIVKYAAENPFKSLSVGLTMAVARAFGESKLRSIIERSITGSSIGGLPGAPGAAVAGGGWQVPGTNSSLTGGGLGVAGNMLAGIQIATATITTVQIGMAYIDSLVEKDAEQQRKDAVSEAQSATDAGVSQRAAHTFGGGHLDPETAKRDGEREAQLQARIDAAIEFSRQKSGAAPDPMAGSEFSDGAQIASAALGPSSKDAATAFDASHLDQLKAEMAELKNIMADIRSGVIKVEVTNQPQDQPKAGGPGTGSNDG